MGKPEETVEGYLVTKAEQLGFLVYKFVSPGNNGVPDRVIIGHNATFFVETKAPGGRPRKQQQKVIDRINDHSGIAFVAASREDVDNILNAIIENESCHKRAHKKFITQLLHLFNKR